MRAVTRAHWQIHFCVVLWGFTAILGKLISLEAPSLVWWRMLIVALALLLAPRVWQGLSLLSPRLIAAYSGVGFLVALHWLTFYSAIKLANASVAVSCLALGPVFLAFLEPWIARRAHEPREVWLGLMVVPGVVLVVGGTPDTMNAGIVAGAMSAFFVAVFGALNKRLVGHSDALTVTWLEMTAGMLFLTAFIPFLVAGPAFALPDFTDSAYLLLLAFGCTLLPFSLSLLALKHLSAFAVQLAVNLEPVYAIVLATILFGEQRALTAGFYFGVAIILGAVFIYPLLGRRSSPFTD